MESLRKEAEEIASRNMGARKQYSIFSIILYLFCTSISVIYVYTYIRTLCIVYVYSKSNKACIFCEGPIFVVDDVSS